MARKTPLTSLRQINEINLTPIMDLTFILLITFIITFPLIEQGIPVALPRGQATELSADASLTVTINREGHMYVDDIQIEMPELEQRLQEHRIHQPDVAVLIRADETLNYGRVVELLLLLHKLQISRLALVTQAENS